MGHDLHKQSSYALEVDGDIGIPAMIGAVQTFGDLVHWHSHVHTIVAEGVFTKSGYFVHIPNIWLHRAIEIWQEKVFSLLLDVGRIDPDVVANMRDWKHSGFSVDMSVRIEAGDHSGMQRLVEYISRCPFSLARMVSVTNDGTILYRAGKAECIPFPKTGDKDLSSGMRRNYEIYDPLDFLAEVTQHIPNKGEHQVRYYGWYSNKKRGMAEKTKKPVVPALPGMPEPDTTYHRKCRMTWAALIKCVYEVDPLKCPKCGGEMKIVAFIEEKTLIEKILRHCRIWQDRKPRPPPKPPPNQLIPPATVERSILDFDFFERNCA